MPGALGAQALSRVQLRFDTAEAVAALGVVTRATPLAAVFGTDAYRRLKQREAAMHRAFTDSAFAAFLQSDSLVAQAGALRRTLSAWEAADLDSASARALAYLPARARIRATVYVVIKPMHNSFVWDAGTDPAIFLYLDPAETPAKFFNTVAHELHHIGYASVSAALDSLIAALPDSAKPVANWVGAFGEGIAMLAAAGGPEVHPHAVSPPAERARWDSDMTHFGDDLRRVDQVFRDILSRRLATPDTIQAVAMSFFGIQGPWYTVGWKMAAMIERRFGRAELIACMSDPHRLLDDYDKAAADSLPHWSQDVVRALVSTK